MVSVHELTDVLPPGLETVSAHKDIPHLLVYGSKGSLASSVVTKIVNSYFKQESLKVKNAPFCFSTSSGRKLELSAFSSQYHLEINPSEAGIYDRVVVQEIISEFAKSKQIDKSGLCMKVVVIQEADRLSRAAQHALRRTMEKFSSNVRVFFVAEGVSKLIPAIRSRCLLLRVPLLTNSEIAAILKNRSIVATEQLLSRINGDAKLAAVCTVEKMAGIDLDDQCELIKNAIVQDHSIKGLIEVRKILFGLFAMCYPAECVIDCLSAKLIHVMDADRQVSIATLASEYATRLDSSNKEIFHVEAFVAQTMALLSG